MAFLNPLNPNDETDFDHFYQLYQKHAPSFHEKYLNHLELFACNYCIRKINAAKEQYLEPLFQFFKTRADSGRILVRGKITAGEYHSIITTALRKGEFDWAVQFLESHKNRIIGTDEPEEYYQYSLANYRFHIGQYDEALTQLLKMNYHNMQYKFSSRILELKIIYEQENEALPAKTNAAKKFFYIEEKIPAERKEMYVNFVNMLLRILHTDTAVSAERIQSLLDDVRAYTAMAERQWLIQKLEKLHAKASRFHITKK